MKRTIAFLTGGYSGEAEISYKSAITIQNHLDKDKWEVYTIDITHQGWYCEIGKEKIEIDRNDFSLNTDDGRKIKFDVVFIGIHGTPGEDGKLQGYLDIIGLPYTSCDAATSALTFNKRFTVGVAHMAGLNVAKSVHLFKQQTISPEKILSTLKLPLFVKPNNGGSSIGMSKVISPVELPAALEKAFKEDDQVLVEEYIKGREFTIGVYKSKGKVIPLPITEIISKKDFFDYEAKYLGASEEITPAKIDKALEELIKTEAVKAYSVFNCQGVIRIDFIFNEEEQKAYMLEINTIPGQSEASIVPQQVAAAGINLKDFYNTLLEECIVL